MLDPKHCVQALLRDFVPGEDAIAEIPLKLEQLPRLRRIVSIPTDMTWEACLHLSAA